MQTTNTSSASTRKNKPSMTIVVPQKYEHQQQRRLAYLPHTTRLSYDNLPISSIHSNKNTTTSNSTRTNYSDRRKSAGALPRLTSTTPQPSVVNRDELSNKIANTFQEFSNMLTQLSTEKQQREQQQKPPVSQPAIVHPSTRSIIETPRSFSPSQQQTNKIRQSTGSLASLPSVVSTVSSCTTFSSLGGDDLREHDKSISSSGSSSNNTTDDERDGTKSKMVLNTATRLIHENGRQEKEEEEEEEMDEDRKKIMQRLSRAVCIDDALTIKSVFHEQKDLSWVDINKPNELGMTLLIHAACFNSLQVIRPLLEAGAKIDKQDKKGWTALLWAVNSRHLDMVKLLLDCGASCDIKTSTGFTVHRLINPQDKVLLSLLPLPSSKSSPRTKTSFQKKKKNNGKKQELSSSPTTSNIDTSSKIKKRRTSTVPKLDQVDLIYYQADMYGYADLASTSTTTTATKTRRSSMFVSSKKEYTTPSDQDNDYNDKNKDSAKDYYNEDSDESDSDEDLEGWEGCMRSIYQFDWNKCLPDQMFVFCQDDMSHILDTAINDVKLPLMSDETRFTAANIIFLCCRFAHYHSKRDLLQDFLTLAINKIAKTIKANPRNIDNLSYWISNSHRLFQYLKRDQGLNETTRDEQQRISQDLLSEAFTLLVSFTQKRLDKFIEPALLDYEEIAGDQQIDFVPDNTSWQRFFRRSSTSSTASHTSATHTTSRPNSLLLSPITPMIPNSNNNTTITPSTLSSSSLSTSTVASSNMVTPATLTSIISSISQTMDSYEIHFKIKEQFIMQCLQYIAIQGFNRLLANKKYLCRSRAIHVRMNVSSIEEWIRHTLRHSVYTCFQQLAQLLQLLQCVSQLHDLNLFQDTMAGFDLLSLVHIRRCVLQYRYEINEPQLPEGVLGFVQQQQSFLSPRNSICSNNSNNSRNPSFDMTRVSMDENYTDWGLLFVNSNGGGLIVPTEALKRDHGIVPSIPEMWLLKLDKK
ncbi:hypothetical protein INT45_004337 [Circinella minor]|uniref:Dilute domain-containing protein n=1 Tax=Circinella minor TaxID=1195481 RepID=A0A8H7SE11_9FUNG|nr:hypothetical protein INT45_004337 [Circinella minor]